MPNSKREQQVKKLAFWPCVEQFMKKNAATAAYISNCACKFCIQENTNLILPGCDLAACLSRKGDWRWFTLKLRAGPERVFLPQIPSSSSSSSSGAVTREKGPTGGGGRNPQCWHVGARPHPPREREGAFGFSLRDITWWKRWSRLLPLTQHSKEEKKKKKHPVQTKPHKKYRFSWHVCCRCL